jgi:hypothetical protein
MAMKVDDKNDKNTKSDFLTDSEEDMNEDTFEFLFRGRERARGMFNTF